jgi:hypothetical protein
MNVHPPVLGALQRLGGAFDVAGRVRAARRHRSLHEAIS